MTGVPRKSLISNVYSRNDTVGLCVLCRYVMYIFTRVPCVVVMTQHFGGHLSSSLVDLLMVIKLVLKSC